MGEDDLETGRVKVARENFATKFRQASRTDEGAVNATRAVGTLLCASIGCTFIIAISNIIPIAMIVVGGIYYDRDRYCPAEPIALLLVIGGVGTLVMSILATYTQATTKEGDEQNSCVQLISGLLNLFSFAWFIATCVIVYRLYSHVNYEDKDATSDYCNRFLYLFAFWVQTSGFIMLGAVIALTCLLACCGICCSRN